MKKFLCFSAILTTLITFSSCEKDEGKLPNISFKTGGSYTSSDVTLAPSSALSIGIDASKSEEKDVLKQFNVSKSVNGGANTTILDKTLSGSEVDNYSYVYSGTVDTTHGQKSKYTFTITNRDGLTNQVSLTVTTQ